MNRDPASWDKLIDSFAERLRVDIRISLYKRGLPVELTEDVSQETWLTAFRNSQTFIWKSEEYFYHWLRVVACNHVHRLRRHSSREVSADESDDGEDEPRPAFAGYHRQERGIEDELEDRELLLTLAEAMKALKPEEREILVRWLSGETPRVLAADFHKLPRTISVTVWRAKQKVNANLAAMQLARNKDMVSPGNTC